MVGLLTLLQCRDRSLVAALAPNFFVLLGTRENEMEVNLGERVNRHDGDPLMSYPFAPHLYEMLRAPQ